MEAQIVQTLQALGNLSLIILCFCMLYGIKRMVQIYQELLIVTARLDSHISLDNEKFSAVNVHLGKHDSLIDDLRISSADRLVHHVKSIINAQQGKEPA